MRRRRLQLRVLPLLLVLPPAMAIAAAGGETFLYRDGPPLAYTGGFGEPHCGICHAGAPLNAEGGTVAVATPACFVPGRPYTIEVQLERAGLAAAGFQLSTRFPAGPDQGRQAGTLESLGPETAVRVDSATTIAYARHTFAGTTPASPGSARWSLRWTAPAASAAVAFHVAANAANDDDSELGDHIYLAETAASPCLETPK